MLEPVNAADRCRGYRRRILEISQQVSAAHVAPAFSCVEMVDALYNTAMREQDIFVMSKGHGCLAQYVVLEERGLLTRGDLDLYCKPGGFLGAHPDRRPEVGINASTGSLGHGLGMATGMVYAERLKGTDTRVYVVLSDGECQEGSTWEAAMMAANLRLGNLIALVDYNDFGGLERMSEGHPAFHPLMGKFAAFGWVTFQVDGHNSRAISTVLSACAMRDRPTCLICETVKGKGVSYMEHNNLWHYRSPSPEEYEQAMLELADG